MAETLRGSVHERSYAAGRSAPIGASDSLTQEVYMNGQTDFTAKVEPEDFKNTLFLAMELSRSTWRVATFAPRLGDKISVHAIPGGDTKRLLELIGRLQAKFRGKDVHGIGARLLREYAEQIGLDHAFTIHDREDSADLMNLVRHEKDFSKTESRFPTKE
jgi:hypothetical protein